mgnify:FL=1
MKTFDKNRARKTLRSVLDCVLSEDEIAAVLTDDPIYKKPKAITSFSLMIWGYRNGYARGFLAGLASQDTIKEVLK